MSSNQQDSPVEGQRISKYKNFSNQNTQQQIRQVRGYAIISKGDTPKQIAKETYTIPSQSGNGEYTITKGLKWRCTCPDFKERGIDCKHIHAVKFYLKVQNKIKEDSLEFEEPKDIPNCIMCGGSDVVKYGRRKSYDKMKHEYRCNNCRKYFISDKDFSKIKGDAKTTTLILDLYFKGISLRGIQDHLKQFSFWLHLLC